MARSGTARRTESVEIKPGENINIAGLSSSNLYQFFEKFEVHACDIPRFVDTLQAERASVANIAISRSSNPGRCIPHLEGDTPQTEKETKDDATTATRRAGGGSSCKISEDSRALVVQRSCH